MDIAAVDTFQLPGRQVYVADLGEWMRVKAVSVNGKIVYIAPLAHDDGDKLTTTTLDKVSRVRDHER